MTLQERPNRQENKITNDISHEIPMTEGEEVQISPVATSANGEQSHQNDRRKYRFNQEFIEKIVTLSPDNPSYPLEKPFEEEYEAVTKGGSYDDYLKKYALASALIEDGRYKNLRFLANKFVAAGQEITPEVKALKDALESRVREELLKRGDKRAQKEAREKLEDFAKNVAQAETLDAQDFRSLVGLFGSSRVVDILYRSRPEFRGIPVDQVKSVLADYLGDFLITRGGFNPDDIEKGLQYLSYPNFQEGLYEVIKDNCLGFYNYNKRVNSPQSDPEIFDEYFQILSLEAERFNNDNVTQVIHRAREYYDSVLQHRSKKPHYVIDYLKESRSFPDVNQLVNIKELEEKKKMLIADEMGLGKSASAIIAKETLGVKQALVIAPSNVIPIWQGYLSDKVDEDGEPIGYFKEGFAPKVLVVENLQSLQEDLSSFDYILMSQEKLNERYTNALGQCDFDMLVVDEIHKVKNLKEGVRASNLVRLAQKIEGEDKYLALLSGTPVPNKIHDIAIILKLLYPEKFRDMDNKDLVKNIINGDLVDLRSLLVPRMQMKSLTESINIPKLEEETRELELSDIEKEIYEVLMEEDEITGTEKIRILRQFLLNPALLDITPQVEGTKIREVGTYLRNSLRDKRKIVMFVNNYIENVIRGGESILRKFDLPEDVEVRSIHGGITSQEERQNIQNDLQRLDRKMLVAVSGQTADVGVDFSGADEVISYNEPWTRYDQKQQLGRAYREGLKHDLKSTTFLVNDTIEQGIRELIEIKYAAVEKLLRGIPITQLEREILEKSEKETEPNLEVNPELARYYFSSWDRLRKMFAYVKEGGETMFSRFVEEHGKSYADSYKLLGRRSYQSNACRVSGTVIDTLIKDNKKNPQELKILDIASGPEMLKKHIAEDYQNQIVSLDINRHQLTEGEGQRIIGSFLSLPIKNNSFDYVNLSLALDQTKFIPSKKEYERLELLKEMNRVLKIGGKAIINLIYTLDLKDIDKFKQISQVLGFKFLDEYSGEISVNQHYRSRIITLEKQTDIEDNMEALANNIAKENSTGLKFIKTNHSIRDSRKIITKFELNERTFPIVFNHEDYRVIEEEEEIISQAVELQKRYGEIKHIPKYEVVNNNFIRILIGNRYKLFKSLKEGNGVVTVG